MGEFMKDFPEPAAVPFEKSLVRPEVGRYQVNGNVILSKPVKVMVPEFIFYEKGPGGICRLNKFKRIWACFDTFCVSLWHRGIFLILTLLS